MYLYVTNKPKKGKRKYGSTSVRVYVYCGMFTFKKNVSTHECVVAKGAKSPVKKMYYIEVVATSAERLLAQARTAVYKEDPISGKRCL